MCVPEETRTQYLHFIFLILSLFADVGQHFEFLALDMPHPLQAGGNSSDTSAPLPPVDETAAFQEAIRVAVAQELAINHLELAIELLKRAQVVYELDLFALQTINPGVVADRTHLFILAQLGHLYALNGNLDKAMEFLMIVSKRYRKEKWWDLLTDALRDMLSCSKARGNISDIIHYSLELMTKRTSLHCPIAPRHALSLNLSFLFQQR